MPQDIAHHHAANIYYTKSTLDTVFFKSTSGTVKYFISTLATNPPFHGPFTQIPTQTVGHLHYILHIDSIIILF